jgi:hypothetical protein
VLQLSLHLLAAWIPVDMHAGFWRKGRHAGQAHMIMCHLQLYSNTWCCSGHMQGFDILLYNIHAHVCITFL